MLCYDRIDVSECIDVIKTSDSEECDIYRCCYFLDKGFKFQSYVCHNVLMMSMNLSDIAILNINGADYCCIVSGISKSEVINSLKNADFTENSGKLLNKIFLSYIKMGKEILTFDDTEIEKQISPTQKPYFNKQYRY